MNRYRSTRARERKTTPRHCYPDTVPGSGNRGGVPDTRGGSGLRRSLHIFSLRGSRDTVPECLSCSPELCILLQCVLGSEPGRRRQRDNLHKGKPGKRTREPATRSRSPFRISDGSGATSQSLQAAPGNRLSFFSPAAIQTADPAQKFCGTLRGAAPKISGFHKSDTQNFPDRPRD